MKILKLTLLSICLILGAQVYGQKFEKKDSITALKLDKILTERFANGFAIQGMDVDKNGILRAQRGYEIVFLEKGKEYVVKPQDRNIPDRNSDNFDIREEGGMTTVCACGMGAGDDCQFYDVPQGNEDRVYCGGRCSCGSFTFLTPNIVREYETMDGGY